MNSNTRISATAGCILSTLIAMLLTIPAQQPVKAQDPLTVGLVGLGAKLLVGSILSDFEERTQRLIDRAGQNGQLAVAHAGSELQLTIGNLKVLMGDLQKKTFADLTEQQQSAFHGLNKTLDRVSQMVNDVRPMSELILLDVRLNVERLRGAFRAEEQDFYISSIRGTTVSYQNHEYRIIVSGLGIGFIGSEPKCVVDAFIDGMELDPFGTFRQEENNRIEVRIPARMLQPKFQDGNVAIAKFAIRSTITKGNKSKTYQVSAPLMLLPKIAGEIEIEEVVEKTKWSEKKETKTITLTRSTGGEKEYRTEELRCLDNQKIVGVRYECNDPRAGWSYSIRKDGVKGQNYDPDFDIVDGGRKAVVHRKLNTAPLTCHYHVDYVTELVTYEKLSKGKFRLKFDELFEVSFSPNNKDGNFKITGNLFTGQKLFLTSGTGDTDKDNPLKLVGRERTGDQHKLTFKLNKMP